MDNFEKLIKQIMIDAGLDDMPEDFQAEYQGKLAAEAQKAMGIAAMKALSEEQVLEFNKLVTASPDETDKIQKFLQENIEDYEGVMVKALNEFREQVIVAAEKLKKEK